MLTTDSAVFIGGVLLIGVIVGLTAASLVWMTMRDSDGEEDDEP